MPLPLSPGAKRTDQGAMDSPHVDWLADGFRVHFTTDPLRPLLSPELVLLYALAGVLASAFHPGMALLWCVPLVIAMWLGQGREGTLTVTHSHLVATAPLRRDLRLSLRELREVEVCDGELELQLWGGRRLRVACGAPGQRLQWAVEHIRQLRDETQAFALDMAEQREETRSVQGLVRRINPRRRNGGS